MKRPSAGAPSVKHRLAVRSGADLRVVGSGPVFGSALGVEPAVRRGLVLARESTVPD